MQRSFGVSVESIVVAFCAVLSLCLPPVSAQSGGPFKLTASDGAAADFFGQSVAIAGDTAVVGTPSSDAGTNSNQGCAYVYRWNGAGWSQLAKLTASDGAANDVLGSSVAISGDTIVVGANGDDMAGGSVYVFIRPPTGWANTTQTAKLIASDRAPLDYFGQAVAISGDTIVVGAIYDNSTKGSAYVFVKPTTGWANTSAYTAKLSPSDGELGDYFGNSVTISGDTIAVGAYGRYAQGYSNGGSVYVFSKPAGGWATTSTWTASLTPSDGADCQWFGGSVSASGDTIVASAWGDNDGTGAAYVFTMPPGGWADMTQTAKLTASDRAEDDRFSSSVAISGDAIVVGAFMDNVGQNADQGSAYVFIKPPGGWANITQTAKLTARDGAEEDAFGWSVAISGDMVLVGANTDVIGTNAAQGSAYVFHRTGSAWVQSENTILASDGVVGDEFGYSIAISGDTLVVGTSHVNSLKGSAYVYRWDGAGGVQLAELTASDGEANDLFGSSVAISGDTIVVGASSDDVGANADQGSAYVFVKPPGGWADMTETAKLTSPFAAAGATFGWSVAVADNTVVVGEPRRTGAQGTIPDQGSAYVFIKPSSGWGTASAYRASLGASDGASYDHLGYSVAISGDTVVAGAYSDSNGTDFALGSVYVFVKPKTYDGWWSTLTETAKLTAADGVRNGYFGNSVAISGDTIVAGAPGDDDNGSASGSAYVFVKPTDGWVTTSTYTTKLTAFDLGVGDCLGASVAIVGDTIVACAPYSDNLTIVSGSAYVFVKPTDGWATTSTYTAKLAAFDGAPGDYLGASVAIFGDMVAVGAIGDDVGANGNQGSVRVFYLGDECRSFVNNTTTGASYATIADAIRHAASGNDLIASSGAFAATNVDYRSKSLGLEATRGIAMPYNRNITLADNAWLATGEGHPLTLFGQLVAPTNATADVLTDELQMGSGALLNARSGAALYLDVPRSCIDGAIRVEANATLSFSGCVTSNGPLNMLTGATLFVDGDFSTNGTATLFGPLYIGGELDLDGYATILAPSVSAGAISIGGKIDYSNTTFSAPTLAVVGSGRFTGYGSIYAAVNNSNRMDMLSDTLISGDLLNNAGAVIAIESGTATLIGSLTNNGTIVGQVQHEAATLQQEDQVADGSQPLSGVSTAPAAALLVEGNYVAGPASSLSMPDPGWRLRVAGNYDVAVSDNTHYDMSRSELYLTGGTGAAQTLEVMSRDIGADIRAFDRTLPGHFPIGTLHIGPGPTSVMLADNHDNDGQGQAACEALYVSTLEIDAGCTLSNPGCRVYYRILINSGTITNSANLARVCATGDFDCDGDVDAWDFAVLKSCASGPKVPCQSACSPKDLDGDGDIDMDDFGRFQRCYSGPKVPADPGCAN